MRMVSLGRAARSKAAVKVRQPLGTVHVSPRTDQERTVLERLRRQVEEELNVKNVVVGDPPGVARRFATNDKLLGPKHGDALRRIKASVAGASEELRAGWYQAFLAAQPIVVALEGGQEVALSGDELNLIVEIAKPWALQEERGYVVAVDSSVTPELAAEGLARELVHRIQTMRRSAEFDIADAIETAFEGDDAVAAVMAVHGDYIKQETLSRSITRGVEPGGYTEDLEVEGRLVRVTLRRA